MHAMILNEERDFQWKEMPDPVPKADEVLIQVAAAAVNRADLMQKDGCYASPEGWPPWCGLEVAGTVLTAPEDCSLKPGDQVCALLGGGGYSEKVIAPSGMVLPIPEGLSMAEAATLPEVWATVYLNLMKEAGGIRRGEIFFVQAGASGVGLAAIQLAKQMGAFVITSVGSEEKAEAVRSFGADIAVNYRKENILDILQQYHPHVVLDCIGGKNMGACLEQMAFGGRWIMIATLGGGETTLNLETIWRKRLKLIGSTLRSRTSGEKAAILQAMQKELWPLFSKQKLLTHLHKVFPIRDVEAAHEVLRTNENIGKVVLTLR